jgi:hypothetical protein
MLFDIKIFTNISSYYTQYNGDKNAIISHILINIRDKKIVTQYIEHLELYISNANSQKELINFIGSGNNL